MYTNSKSTYEILKSLNIYILAQEVIVEIYSLAKQLPIEERFNITDQIRRSAISIGANIAEGYLRKAVKDRARFLRIAKASLAETIFLLDISVKLGYFPQKLIEPILQKLQSLDIKIYNLSVSSK